MCLLSALSALFATVDLEESYVNLVALELERRVELVDVFLVLSVSMLMSYFRDKNLRKSMTWTITSGQYTPAWW